MSTYRTVPWTEERIAQAKRRGQWPPREHVLEWLRTERNLASDQAVEALRAGLSAAEIQAMCRWFKTAHPEFAAAAERVLG